MSETNNNDNEDCACNNEHSKPGQNLCRSVDNYFPFSAEELTIYHKLRCLIKKAGIVKKRLKEIEAIVEPDTSVLLEKAVYMDRLKRLRGEWASWKEKSIEAATRRMIALGHFDPRDKGIPGACECSCPLDEQPDLHTG